jgi:hypothetical protein
MASEKEMVAGAVQETKRSTDDSVSGSSTSQKSDWLRCPKCYSIRIREYSLPVLLTFLAFPCLLLTSLVILAIGEAFGTDRLSIVLFALILAMTFLPSAFLVAVSFALIGKHRCKSCGYRFRTGDESVKVEPKVRFPTVYSVLSTLFLFVSFVIWHLAIMHVSGGIYKPTDLRIIGAVVVWSFIACLCIFYQSVVYRFLRTRIKSPLTWAILFLLPAIIISSLRIHASLPGVTAQRLLSEAGLAPLPKSATDLRVYGWWFPDEAGRCLMFRATIDDIEAFLNTSPSLEGRQCEKFSTERMRVEYPSDIKKYMEYQQAGHALFVPESTPSWYKEEIRKSGRYYSIPSQNRPNSCEIIVNDEEHIVYIKMIRD